MVVLPRQSDPLNIPQCLVNKINNFLKRYKIILIDFNQFKPFPSPLGPSYEDSLPLRKIFNVGNPGILNR